MHDERITDVEVRLAVLETRFENLTEAIKANTVAQNKMTEAIQQVKGGKAVLIGVGASVVGLATIIGVILQLFTGKS